MTETTFENLLKQILNTAEDMDEDELNEWGRFKEIEGVDTYKHAGLLGYNKGLVVEMKDGSEFQITIVQSKKSRTEEESEDEEDETEAEDEDS